MHSFHTLPADLSAVAVDDVAIGESGSIKLAAAPTPAQQKAFDLLDINPTKMFPAAGRQESANRAPDKINLCFCNVKFSL